MTRESNPNRAPAAPDLLPCPLCGGKAKLFGLAGHMPASVNCTVCDAYGPSVMGKETAAAAWNRRAAPVPASTGRDSMLREAAQLLLYRYDEMREKKGAPSAVEFELLREGLSREPVAARELDADAERRAFEVAMNASRFFPAELDFTRTKSPSGRDEYENSHLQSNWEGWQARAILAARATAESAPASAAPREAEKELYTCIGRGGRYELIGTAKAAGTMRDVLITNDFTVYRNVDSGIFYTRIPADFDARMKRIELAPSNSPVGAKEQDK